MSKMRVPKMDVVRFKENDVIVASGAKTMTISNFGDGIRSNGKYTFGSFSYPYGEGYTRFASFISNFNSYFGANIQSGNQIFFDPGNGVSPDLYTLINIEANDSAANSIYNSIYNGTYSWDGVKFNRQ